MISKFRGWVGATTGLGSWTQMVPVASFIMAFGEEEKKGSGFLTLASNCTKGKKKWQLCGGTAGRVEVWDMRA